MKEKIYVLFVLILFVITLSFLSKIDTTYTIEGLVIKQEENIIFLQDTTGNIWKVTDRKDLKENDKVLITFDNKHTTTKEDDEIKKIEKNT